VTDVHGSPDAIAETGVCQNAECERPFESNELDRETCPHCGEILTETAIHPVGFVTCEPARGGRSGYSTRPIPTVHIDQTSTDESYFTDLFGIDCEMSVGDFDVVDFIYAFERFHSRRSDKETLLSEAVIDASGGSDPDDLDSSLDELLGEVDETTYRPIGQQYHTRGLRFQLDRETFEGRLNGYGRGDDITRPQALVSLQQALEKSVAIIAECDRDDFRVKVTDTGENIDIFVVDSREGGNGVTWQVYKSIQEGDVLERRIHEIAGCENCSGYCDECLLIARTPAFYLEKDLLNKFALRAVIGMN
jgi:hypothetical protein